MAAPRKDRVEHAGPYYRARYYDSMTGRFVSEDPLGFGGGPNLYAYVRNNSTNRIDPLGLAPVVYPNWLESWVHWLRNGGFIYYGHWGGPGWTGGQLTPFEDLSPAEQAALLDPNNKAAAPIDAQDACYQEHDLCYSKARVKNQCTTNSKPNSSQRRAESGDEGSCDFQLAMCLAHVNSSHSGNLSSILAQPVFSVRELFK